MKKQRFKILRFVFVSITAMGLCTNSVAQIKFEEGTWSEIKAKAKAEHKLIFLDANTSWCGPCKRMAKNVFTNDTVANYYNATYVNAKIDMEVGEGKDIAKQFAINAYPTLLFVDAEGEMVHRDVGARSAAQFIQLGKDAQIPEKQFGTLTKKYKNGQRDKPFLRSYLVALEKMYLPTSIVAMEYLKDQKDEELINQDNWNIINAYVTDYKTEAFIYLLKQRAVFAKKYSLDSVNKKLYDVYSNRCSHLIYSKDADSAGYFQFKEIVRKSGFEQSDELLMKADIGYYNHKKDYDNFPKTVVLYIEKYNTQDGYLLNYYAYEFYQNVKDKAMLAKAEQWGKKAYELVPDPQGTLDTYACILSVNGQKKEAIRLEKQAIEEMKADPVKYDQSLIPAMESKIADWSK